MTGVMTGLPAFSDINLARMLHGEQYIEIKKNFPTSGIEFILARKIYVG